MKKHLSVFGIFLAGLTFSQPCSPPTFTFVSPQNFTLGCSTKSVAIAQIVNASTNPPGGAVTYTMLSPGAASTLPSGFLSSASVYSITAPGSYTFVVRDMSNQCESRAVFSIFSNTVAPTIDSVSIPNKILDCNTSQVQLKGYSNSPNVNYVWSFPGSPGNSPGSTYVVNSNMASPTSTLIANYTLSVTDNNNTCKSTTIIPVFQNLFPPVASISNGGLNSISCTSQTVMLTNASSSGIPPSVFPNNQAVIGFIWMGPSPQPSASTVSFYVATLPGTYTLIAKDLNNGCTSMATKIVLDNRIYPVVNNPTAPSYCLEGLTVNISPTINGSTSNLNFNWTAPPGASVSGVNNQYLSANSYGTYTVVVTNTATGCSSNGLVYVVNCTGIRSQEHAPWEIKVFPNPGSGIFIIKIPSSFDGCSIKIFNSLGLLMRTATVVNENFNKIDLQNENNGLYIIQISNNQGQVVYSRIIKE